MSVNIDKITAMSRIDRQILLIAPDNNHLNCQKHNKAREIVLKRQDVPTMQIIQKSPENANQCIEDGECSIKWKLRIL